MQVMKPRWQRRRFEWSLGEPFGLERLDESLHDRRLLRRKAPIGQRHRALAPLVDEVSLRIATNRDEIAPWDDERPTASCPANLLRIDHEIAHRHGPFLEEERDRRADHEQGIGKFRRRALRLALGDHHFHHGRKVIAHEAQVITKRVRHRKSDRLHGTTHCVSLIVNGTFLKYFSVSASTRDVNSPYATPSSSVL